MKPALLLLNMNGIIIYKGRRNITQVINGHSMHVRPEDYLELSIDECLRVMAHDTRFHPDHRTERMIKNLRTGRNNTDEITDKLTGQDCFLLGRGPSLEKIDLKKLKNRYVMAINDSMDYVPFPDSVVFVDKDFIIKKDGEYLQKLREYTGMIFAAYRTGYEDFDKRKNVFIFETNRKAPQPKMECGVYNGQMSGVAAISIALIMNAKRIFLLGYDMDPHAKFSHYKSNYITNHYLDKIWIEQRLKQFRKFEEFRDRIFNLNPDSYIDTFNYLNIDEVL